LILTDPLLPPFSDVWAVMVTFPERFPVTTPLPDTVAVLVLELDQKKLWLVMTFPLPSVAVAESCIVDPGLSFFDGAVTVTLDAGPGVTVIVAVPLTPSTVAVIVATPTFEVVTWPAFTAATAGLSLAQAADLPPIELPLASLGVAARFRVSPACNELVAGLMSTRATVGWETLGGVGDGGVGGEGGGVLLATLTVAMPDFPSAFAAIFEVPTASAVTTPSAEILTILGSCTVQVTAASGTTAPESSRTSARKGSRSSSVIVELAGLTTIAATFGVTSGAVLPHDQLDNATTIMAASVRSLPNISPLLQSCARTTAARTLTCAGRVRRRWNPAYGVPTRSLTEAFANSHRS
jgi:hypothetical protein